LKKISTAVGFHALGFTDRSLGREVMGCLRHPLMNRWPRLAAILVLLMVCGVPLAQATATTTTLTLSSSSVATGTVVTFTAAVSNGDGIADVASANLNSNNVSILLGTGTGTFATKVNYSAGRSPSSVAVGDFNGDGIPDLVVANSSSSNVSVLLGTGTGTFATSVNYAAGSSPISVAVGDFNGDGIADLVVANSTSATVSVLLGTGTGAFGTPVTYAVGTAPNSVAVGDFNGDGIADLVVANSSSSNVSVLLGTGTGTFATQVNYAVGSQPMSVAVGDFNGDGIPDLAVANSSSSTASILLGTGTGTFGTQVTYPTGNTPVSVTVGDFNGDGFADLVLADNGASNVTVLLGTGTGTFGTQISYSTGNSPDAVAIGDFDGDGNADLVVGNGGVSTVSVLRNNVTQTATAVEAAVSIPGNGAHFVDASYPGDTNFASSISATTSLTATPVATTVVVTAAPGSSTFGQQVVLTATLTPSLIGGLTTDGDIVSFKLGATVVGTGSLTTGVATFSLTTLPAGTDVLTAVYAGDPNFLTSTSSSLSYVVNPVTPTITWATPAAVSYGTILSATQLNATAFNASVSVPGTFVYNPAAGTTPAAGSDTLSVVFTPTDAVDFTTATGSVTLTVGKTTPVITWNTPTAITFGATLSATQLNATTTTPGVFVYSPLAGTVPATGSDTLSVTFTPTDVTDYNAATGTVTLTVNKATPVITWATPAAISFGTTLSATQLNATASVTGTFVYSPAAGTTPATGADTLSVTFTPTDSANYNNATGSVTLTVNKVTPTITWATPAVISSGTLLSGTQLNATASVAGTFVYSPAAGTAPATGTDTLSVAFTPTDTTDYNNASGSVLLVVNQGNSAVSLVSSVNPSLFGSSVPFAATVTSSSTGAVTGSVTFKDGATSIGSGLLSGGGVAIVSTSSLTAGSHSITAVYSGDTNNGSSTSSILTQVIQLSTSTVLTSSLSPSMPGNAVVFTATVTSSVGTPTGSVTFSDSGTALGVGTLNGSGVATYSTTALAPGAHLITATYGASGNYLADTSSVLTQAVQQTVVVTLTSSVSPSQPGSSVTFTATLAAGSTTPTGSITFLDGATMIGIGTLSSGITATVTPGSSGMPTGAVTFLNGATPLGTATLDGSGAATFATSGLGVGSHSIIANYAGDADNLPSTATLTFVVSDGVPVITWTNPGAIVYGTTLSSTQLNATASVPGTFAYSPAAGTTPVTGTDTLSVTFTPTDTADYTAATATVTLTVTQATPAITWATPAAITSGAALNSTQLDATASTAGTFVYTPAAGTIPATGSDILSVTFTPTDTTNYTTAIATVTLTVGKATPTITWATPAAIIGGAALSSAQLNATASLPGTFVYTPAAGTTPATGSDILSVTFTPTDTTDYNTATATVTLTVGKATPAITWATPTAIISGAALSSTQLNATASVPGTFVYTPGAGTTPATGSDILSVTFTPTDTTDYNTATATVTLVVGKATPTITWATPTAIISGGALSSTQLNATASVAGTFVYSPAAGTIPATGSDILSVTFTPTDTTDYNNATATVTLVVGKATPTITWATPAAIASGTALSSTQLNATASVPGTFVYTPAAGTIPATGSDILSVTFTPTDTTDYNTATATVTLTVGKATPTITWATPTAIISGAALSSTQLNATASVPGTFVYTPAAGTIPATGSDILSVTFTPTDAVNYTTATATVTLSVGQSTPTITWTTPASIVYGNVLSSTQLNATASVAGTFVYNPAAGSTPATGTDTLSATFTPTDTTDYTNATATVSLTVSKATPAITWATPAAIISGTALSGTQLNATSSVAGTFVYNPAAGTTPATGSDILSVTFVPTNTTNYNNATANVTLTVGKATPTITWATPAAITSGTVLSSTQLDASASVAGTFVYAPAAGTTPATGSDILSLIFTPTDTTDYNTATATVTLIVGKVTPTITWATPVAITFGTTLGSIQLNATASVGGTFVYNPATGSTPAEGSDILSVTFTPTDSTDYTNATASVTLTVGRTTPTITWTTPATSTFGIALGSAQLDATASVPGTFVYTPAAGSIPAAGSDLLSVSFTPTTTTDYTPATATVTLTVNKATPTITWVTPATITSGTALSSTQLNATASTAGVFEYSPAAGTIPAAGTDTLSVSFTPTDNGDYNIATASVSLVVAPNLGPVTPTINWATPAAITTGTALSGIQLNATASAGGTAVNGTFLYSPAAGSIPAIGVETLTVVFTPADNVDYTTATASVVLTVGNFFSLDFTGSPTQTIQQGAAAIYSFTIAPNGLATLPSEVTFTTTGLPPGATVTFAPPTIPAGSASTVVTITINTSSSQAANHPGSSSESGGPTALGMLLLPVLGIVSLRKRLAKIPQFRSALVFGVLSLGAIMGLAGCGAVSTVGTSPTTKSYTVVVTAHCGALQHSANLIVKVANLPHFS
jgi:hypothetical protein